MSRSTFREASGDVAWQRQLRDRHAAEGVPDVPHLDLKRAVVRPVSRRVAEQVILKYEWLGTMASTGRHYGIFYGPYCAGVCCVAVGSGTAGSNTHKFFGVGTRELATLARGACVHWAPAGSNSKLVSWTVRLLARETSAKLVMAYSDTDAGEIGTIYQACNWVCVGRGEAARQIVAPNGRVYDERTVSGWAADRQINKRDMWRLLKDDGWVMQRANGKYRYVCVLDKSDTALVARVESLRQPYPKRAKHPSDAPGDQPGESGAAPTRTLQHDQVSV